ncbi:murein biosynthesis integral membrane protein MurJ [Clostridium polynesiense]|uniref:murein biosynthesis integral membrane protein MurJ n=1 Tax=Clostridium polynesiense TaxID=1325933 RepID=UPI00058EC9C6|nr:murein biosynthesis integral membrane protein MurJ [Clostridium polynesiense]
MSEKNIKKSLLYFVILAVASKGFGFIREQFIAFGYGADYTIDAYSVALLIPNVIFSIVGSSISTAMLPMLVQQYQREGKEKTFKFINNVFNLILIITIIIFIFVKGNLEFLIRAAAPSFSEETFNLALKLGNITLINLVFLCLSSVFITALQSLNEFTATNLVHIPLSIIIIIYIALFRNLTVEGLIIVTIIGNFFKFLIPIPWLIKHGYRYKFILDLKDERIKELSKLIIPVIIGAVIQQIKILVDNSMASSLPQGSIAVLGYSSKISDIMYGLISTALITVIYPALSKSALNKDSEGTRQLLCNSLNYHNLIMFPLIAILASNSLSVVNIIFTRGKFDYNAAVITSRIMIYEIITTAFIGMKDILNQGLYSLKHTKKVTRNTAFGVMINIILSILLVNHLGLTGLMAASLSASIVTALLAYISISKIFTDLRKITIWKGTLQCFASALISVSAIMILNMVLGRYRAMGDFLRFTLCGSVGLSIYIITLFLAKNSEIYFLYDELKKMFREKVIIRIKNSYKAYYIYRLDDITEHMNWDNFWKVIMIFKKYNVVPLIGVVPDNKDKDLIVSEGKFYFWEIIKYMQQHKIVEIAQHGYTHEVILNTEGILKERYGYKKTSEFTGLNLEKQLEKITLGKEILLSKGISTDIFMAPCHNFDGNTLKALKASGFKYITDGIGLTPYKYKGITFIPQQFGRPRSFFFGVITICLHLNNGSQEEINEIEEHVKKYRDKAINFYDAGKVRESKVINSIFKVFYLLMRYFKFKHTASKSSNWKIKG